MEERKPKLNKTQRAALQNKAIEMIVENPRASLSSISLALGLNKNAVWAWINDNVDGFKPRYEEILNETFSSLELPAITSLGELVEEKNFQAVKYVLDNKGYKAVDKVETVQEVTYTISIEEN